MLGLLSAYAPPLFSGTFHAYVGASLHCAPFLGGTRDEAQCGPQEAAPRLLQMGQAMEFAVCRVPCKVTTWHVLFTNHQVSKS